MYIIEIVCWFTIASAKLREPLFFVFVWVFFSLFEDLLFILMDCTHDLES